MVLTGKNNCVRPTATPTATPEKKLWCFGFWLMMPTVQTSGEGIPKPSNEEKNSKDKT